MPPQPQPEPGILLYQTEDGRTRIQCRFEHETIWLTQAQIADLFQTTPQNITLHLKAIYAEGELTEEGTCKQYLQVPPQLHTPRRERTATRLHEDRSRPKSFKSTLGETATIKPH